MGELLANLYYTGLMVGSKNLEKMLLNRHIKILSYSILESPNKPGKNKLAKNFPMLCLSSIEITYLFTSYENDSMQIFYHDVLSHSSNCQQVDTTQTTKKVKLVDITLARLL